MSILFILNIDDSNSKVRNNQDSLVSSCFLHIPGTIAPSLVEPAHQDYNNSIDVIFATYWFYPAKTEVILPKDQECIDRKMAEETIRFDPNSKADKKLRVISLMERNNCVFFY